MFVSAERLKQMDPGRLTTADLVVEALSPSTAVYDRTTKADTCAALGVGELWFVDTVKQTIEQWVLGAEAWERTPMYASGEVLSAICLPGLTCEGRAIFA
jgi:Uma2 family endonuclease